MNVPVINGSPQKKFGRMLLMYMVGALISSPKLQKKAGDKRIKQNKPPSG